MLACWLAVKPAFAVFAAPLPELCPPSVNPSVPGWNRQIIVQGPRLSFDFGNFRLSASAVMGPQQSSRLYRNYIPFWA